MVGSAGEEMHSRRTWRSSDGVKEPEEWKMPARVAVARGAGGALGDCLEGHESAKQRLLQVEHPRHTGKEGDGLHAIDTPSTRPPSAVAGQEVLRDSMIKDAGTSQEVEVLFEHSK